MQDSFKFHYVAFTWNLKMIVHINPRISRGLPSTISSAPIDSNRTYKMIIVKVIGSIDLNLNHYISVYDWLIELITLVWRNAKHLFTFSILWTLIFPELGFPSFSPDMISNSFIRHFPSARSMNRSFIWNVRMNSFEWHTINWFHLLLSYHLLVIIKKLTSILTLIRNELTHLVKVFFWM